MEKIQVGLATIEWLEADQPYVGKPMDGGEYEIEGICDKFRVTTLDELNMVFAVIRWPSHKPQVSCITKIFGQEKYDRLEDAGRLGIFQTVENDRTLWSFELRTMKYGENQLRQTLKQSTLQDLDYLMEGQSALELLNRHGALRVGKRGELAPATASNRSNELFVIGDAENKDLVAVAFTITRVLAVMKDFGK
jgi:hypothetical protein